ncbi:MAG: hypothetical protein U0P45_11405 [Acidimicrobiales bacterium]
MTRPTQLRRRRPAPGPLAAAALLAAGSLLLAACGGGSSGGEAASTTEAPAAPAKCKAPPVTVDLEAKGDAPAGSSDFEVTDAVARRVAILPGEMAFDPSALSNLESKASVTPLAAYSLYMADFRVPRTELTTGGLGVVSPGDGQTLAVLSMVPANEDGFIEGAVVQDGELGYESRSSMRPLQLTVLADGNATPQAYTDVAGQVEILQLDDEHLCVDMDVTFTNGSDVVYRAKGAIQAPVVRAPDSFFYN